MKNINLVEIFQKHTLPFNQASMLLPRSEWIKKQGWQSRMFIYDYDFFEACMIFNAMKAYDLQQVYYYSIPNQGELADIQVKKLSQDIDASFIYLFNSNDSSLSFQSGGFFNDALDFLYFKDEYNTVYILFGNETFLNKIFPISKEDYKNYIHYTIHDYCDVKEYATYIYNLYSSFS